VEDKSKHSENTGTQGTLRDLVAELDRHGFRLCKALAPRMSTIEIAQAFGTVISVKDLLPSSGIPTVQSLRPRNTSEVGRSQYSGHYGLCAFPLHTDLAHWALPPHYFLLRCVAGSNDVFTLVLDWAPIVEMLGAAALRKAVFAARKRRIGYSGLVRAMSDHEGTVVLRWDPIFLKPLNQLAHVLANAMRDSAWNEKAVKILLTEPGDTLIVDNWRVLHGRGQVMPNSTGRRIERVYLSEVFQ
jgi:L-asparagine oxygenase